MPSLENRPAEDTLDALKVPSSVEADVGKLELESANSNFLTIDNLPTYSSPAPSRTAVLVMTCNRPTVSRALKSIFRYKPKNRFPVIVSQDCEHENTTLAINSFKSQLHHVLQPDRSPPRLLAGHEDYGGYYRIARHYHWAITQVLDVLMFDQVIIVEDDMEIAPDFFRYFEAFTPILRTDPTVICVSAWNDNGKATLAQDSHRFLRTDFFPGLGWMLTNTFWDEIKNKWPLTFWDDWLRHPNNRKGRACIRPEMSRTFNFGKEGVSGGQFYDEHIGRIVLSKDETVRFTGFDQKTLQLSRNVPELVPSSSIDVRLFLKEQFDQRYVQQVYDLASDIHVEELLRLIESENPQSFKQYSDNANVVSVLGGVSEDTKSPQSQHYCGDNCSRRFRIQYAPDYSGKAGLGQQIESLGRFQLMTDIREDCARMSYLGVVEFKQFVKSTGESITVFIAPESRPQLLAQ